MEAQWLSQMTFMRRAIQDLKLNLPTAQLNAYGDNLVIDDEDLTVGSGSDDLWNMSSENEDDGYSSDMLDGIEQSTDSLENSGSGHGHHWLETKCQVFAARNSDIDAEELRQQLFAMLASDTRGMYGPYILYSETKPLYR